MKFWAKFVHIQSRKCIWKRLRNDSNFVCLIIIIKCLHLSVLINSLWPSDAIDLGQHCLTAPSHYLNQCWLIISKVQWHASENNFTRNTSAICDWRLLENELSKTTLKSPRGHWVKPTKFMVPIGRWLCIPDALYVYCNFFQPVKENVWDSIHSRYTYWYVVFVIRNLEIIYLWSVLGMYVCTYESISNASRWLGYPLRTRINVKPLIHV